MKQIPRGTHRALRSAVGAAMCLFAIVGLTGISATSSRAQATKGGDMVPLPIKLPKAAFAGTPPANSVIGANVEKPTGKPRPIPMVPKGTVNLALHKKVKPMTKTFLGSPIELITDGDKEARDDSSTELPPGVQWIQIDLGATSPLSYIVFWHAHLEAVVYHAVVVQVSDDPLFHDGVTTLFNNDQENVTLQGIGKDKEYFETSEGKQVDAKGTRARYVRLWSKGSTFHDKLNRYTEVEVYGLPAK